MKNWQRFLVQSTVISTLSANAPKILAQTFDYSLLVGEWSQPGMCDTSRYVYTAEGDYTRLKKEGDGDWQTVYQGVYVVKPDNSVVIAEGTQEGGFAFNTVELTEQNYVSQEVISGGGTQKTFSYEKCPSR